MSYSQLLLCSHMGMVDIVIGGFGIEYTNFDIDIKNIIHGHMKTQESKDL